MLSKKDLSERDICTKYITPAIEQAGWDIQAQVREEVTFTDGKIYVRGKLTARGKKKRADYILYYKPNIPIAIIEAKDNNHSVRSGMQQALVYAEILDVPCAFSSNGDAFIFHDRTQSSGQIETELDLNSFPTPAQLWERYKAYKGISDSETERIASQDYYFDVSGRKPRYYQQIAINRTVEAIANGQNRIILTMATGTGKTYVAFQTIYRLWKAGVKKRILFLADRNALIDQTRRNDFKHFKDKMTVVKHRQIDKAFEIYLALYQGLTGNEEDANVYKEFSPDFFDLVVVDECHRGSADADSAWHEILKYFKNATHLGLTATPKETKSVSNIEYFGDPLYTYSLRQGIEDGFLAPYRVVRIGIDVDMEGWRPEQGKTDKDGNLVEDRVFNRKDFDKNLVIDERTDLVARKLTEFLKGTDRFDKTIVFCVDINHAERMRAALINHNADIARDNHKYIMQITGDNIEGKRELDNFINPEEKFPVIATTSKLMTTGIDAQTCKVIVLDSNIRSMTEFKQIIGRGTRINEEFDKLYFTILDFRNVTDLFADEKFDGDPVQVKVVTGDDDISNIEGEEEEADKPTTDDEGTNVFPDPPPSPPTPPGGETPKSEPHQKVYVNGVDVTILVTREMYFDRHGKPITTSLKDHTREIIQDHYATLNEFLNKWSASDRKTAILKEFEEEGVLVEELQKAVGKDFDLFDMICHVAFDTPPLTRRERANNVKKRNYFTKYGQEARRILEALLDKYADEGITDIESMDILKVSPLDQFGSPMEIVDAFGGKEQYLKALSELEEEIYKEVA